MKKNERIRLVQKDDAGLSVAQEIERLNLEKQGLAMIIKRRIDWFQVKENYSHPCFDYMYNSTRSYIREFNAVAAKLKRLKAPVDIERIEFALAV